MARDRASGRLGRELGAQARRRRAQEEMRKRPTVAGSAKRKSMGSRMLRWRCLMVPIASSSDSTIKLVIPSSITSGTEPWRNAITGVPQAIASIITSPNGSGP